MSTPRRAPRWYTIKVSSYYLAEWTDWAGYGPDRLVLKNHIKAFIAGCWLRGDNVPEAAVQLKLFVDAGLITGKEQGSEGDQPDGVA